MNPELFAYPFLFLAIFFESFVLVTLLSRPARDARRDDVLDAGGAELPSVAIIVPCWNEAATVAATCESLFALDYPREKLEIILVNDGSTDETSVVMERFAHYPHVRIIHKENGGKHTALNAGIATTKAGYIGCLDADSSVDPDALRKLVRCFERPSVAAATAAMSVHRPGNLLQHMQNAEYSFGITLRHTFASVNGLYVTPGPFSFYRRAVIEELGGFRYGHQTEDMEMALRMQQAGYEIANAHQARVYTKVPATVALLIKQRTRWVSGFLRNILGEYRGLIGNRGRPALGMVVLPIALLSIVSGVTLFGLMLFLSTRNALAAIEVRTGIPLSYALAPHGTFDWFYLPAHLYIVLAIIVFFSSVALIFVGKRISETPGHTMPGLIGYLVLYGFVAPLWLIRATSDVARGKRRGWRQ